MANGLPTTEAEAKNALDLALDVGNGPAATPASAGSRNGDDYRINLPCFEGPLDLLLHLIRKEQLNIYDIPIAKICKSYVEYLELMKQLDFNVAGEFMVMASTLTYMKSLTLLPRDENAEEEEDPRLPLVAQLLEYEKFKRAADIIDARQWLGRDIYERPPGAFQDVIPTEALLDAPIEPVDTYLLLKCLKIAVDRTTRPPMQIETDPVSIKHKATAVTTFLAETDIIEFMRLLPTPEERHVRDIIVSFLAILELAKLKFIEIIQTETFGPIQVRGVRPLHELNLSLLDQY